MSEGEIESMEVEMAVLKQLDHPNIIKLFEIFEDEKYICLVIELMEGGELYDMIEQKVQFSEKDTKIVVKNLIGSLQYCHSMGILHRDIKPENLLFPTKERDLNNIKLSDFGLAKILEDN